MAMPTYRKRTSQVNPLTAAEVEENFDYVMALHPFRNRLPNAGAEVVQIASSFGTAGTDMWDGWRKFYAGTGLVSGSRSTDVPTNAAYRYSMRVDCGGTTTAATSGVFFIEALMEGFWVRDLVGEPIAISFDCKTNKTGTYCVALRNGNRDRTYIWEYTVSAADTWETKELLLPTGIDTSVGTWDLTNGTGAVLTFVFHAGTSYHTTAGGWQTVPSGLNADVATSNQAPLLDHVDNYFLLGGPQLERSRKASVREIRSLDIEMPIMQRYFEMSFENGTSYLSVTNNGVEATRKTAAGEGGTFFGARFKVVKRATPTVTWYNPSSGTAGQIRDASAAANMTVTGTSTNDPTTINRPGSPTHAASAGAVSSLILGHWIADARLT